MNDREDIEEPVLRPLVWLRNTRSNVQAFPAGAKKIIGDELQLIQFGGMPKDAKPFKGVGSGVIRDCLAARCRGVSHGAGGAAREENLRVACLSEEVEKRHCDAEA